MAPSFAELKERAAKAKDAGVTKYQNTRDRHTSVPLKKTNWDPYSGKPPPPPPAPRASVSSRPLTVSPSPPPPPPQRAGSIISHSSSSIPPPPPVKRASRPPLRATSTTSSGDNAGPPLPSRAPSYTSQAPSYGSQELDIDWTKLSQQDKDVFFSWLDEFFERSYGIPARRYSCKTGQACT